ncbi:MAG: hypothetical protein PUF50_00635 [Erysipelotrichaceae bacterium]|nr:hypothetical protein [Erysipelotrichaceae bacterium]
MKKSLESAKEKLDTDKKVLEFSREKFEQEQEDLKCLEKSLKDKAVRLNEWGMQIKDKKLLMLRKIIQTMKDNGLSVEQISIYMNVQPETIEQLLN